MSAAKTRMAEALARAPIFADLTAEEMEYLSQRAAPRRYEGGELVFAEGEPCSGLYVVESGSIKIFKTSASGREQVLSLDGPGSSIAELPVFDGGGYPASVSAVGEATLVFISKKDFQSLCLAHPQVALKVLRVVGQRLRRLVGIIEELSFTTVRQRLAALLCRFAESEGRRTSAGIEFALPENQQELASRIGTVRELVSRNLGRLQSQGIIRLEARNVTVTDLKRLRLEAESGE